MLVIIRLRAPIFRRSWCTISSSVRSNGRGVPATAPLVEDDLRSQNSSEPAAELQQSPIASSKTDADPTAMRGDAKYSSDVDQYQSLITDHAIKRSQISKMLDFVKRARDLGNRAPKQIGLDNMLTLLGERSIRKRRRFLTYLSHKEEKMERKLNPKSPRIYTEPLPRKVVTTEIPGDYGLHLNAILIRIQDGSMHRFLETRLVAHMPFAYKIALDFGFGHLMSKREANKAVQDVRYLYSYNRSSSEPFNLTFCSFADAENDDSSAEPSAVAAGIREVLIDNRVGTFPCECTSRPVTDVFPREQIVYLSPEGEHELETLDEDKVYVLGVLVDKDHQPGSSAERARQLGVRSARFPARVRLYWEQNEKPLHVEHCLRVLHDIKNGKDWQYAISRITRKFVVDVNTEVG